ncbi:MAG: hypothetical protein KF774_08475 [Planctomyces sp.]|nr:hypothetical protein [Planctomyces sp.]
MSCKHWLLSAAACVGLALPSVAHAHFLWFVQKAESGQTEVHVYFSEDAEADDPALLNRLADLKAKRISPRAVEELALTKGEDSLQAPLPADDANFVVGVCDFGVIARGDAKFRLKYYAKGGPAITNPAWQSLDAGKELELDVRPAIDADGQLLVTVQWRGKPAEGAEVTAVLPNVGDVKSAADAQGQARFPLNASGLHAVRARVMEEASGEHNGQQYDSIRHYSTVTFQVSEPTTVTAAKIPADMAQLAPLTPPATSLGGAVVGDALYVYGGNLASAHSYSNEGQGRDLFRLRLDGSGQWESISQGPGLQGLALVAHGRHLYRIGGFTAKNAEGEEHDLWSQNTAARFDLDSGEWQPLPDLPEARSSHDAAIVGDTLYVVGGWALEGSKNTWHTTAWSMDLTAETPEWKALPAPGFERRALALAAHQDRLYVIGGMQKEGGPCTKVSIFDPRSGAWSEGPSIEGKPMAGFGSSAFAVGGDLFVSTSESTLQRLSADGQRWETVQELPTGRFFHRMLPIDDHRVVIVGGASMQSGKFEEVDVVTVR